MGTFSVGFMFVTVWVPLVLALCLLQCGYLYCWLYVCYSVGTFNVGLMFVTVWVPLVLALCMCVCLCRVHVYRFTARE